MHPSTKFWNKTAAKYAQRPIADQDAYLQKIKITQGYLNADMDVLEFGCGTGSTALIHAPKVRSYLATDASEKMIEIGRSKLAGTTVSNLQFQVAEIADLVSSEPRFDAILGLNILHLLHEPMKTVSDVFNILKPGGVFISSTACLKDKKVFLKPILTLARWSRFAPYVAFISREELLAGHERCGFQIEHHWVPHTSQDVSFLVVSKPL